MRLLRMLPMLLIGCGLPLTASGPAKRAPLPRPLPSEQTEIYHDFLVTYQKASKWTLHVADTTSAAFVPTTELDPCADDFAGVPVNSVVHRLPASVIADVDAKLVDAALHVVADPRDTVQLGMPLDDAVKLGFKTGLFTFSDIVFNKAHTKAIFTYTFHCGRLCGHGGSVVYGLEGGHWHNLQLRCSNWIS